MIQAFYISSVLCYSPCCLWVALIDSIALLSNFTELMIWLSLFLCVDIVIFLAWLLGQRVFFWDGFFQIKLENSHLIAPCPVWMAAVGTVMPSREPLRNSFCVDMYFLEANESKKFKPYTFSGLVMRDLCFVVCSFTFFPETFEKISLVLDCRLFVSFRCCKGQPH